MVSEADFSVVLRFLFSAANRELTDQTVSAYWLVLREFPLEDLEAVVIRMARRGGPVPSAGDLHSAVVAYRYEKGGYMDAGVRHEIRVAEAIRRARLKGKSREEIDELMLELDERFSRSLTLQSKEQPGI